MHGGANGSGAPRGERNGSWQTGQWTNGAKAARRAASEVVKAARQSLSET